MKNLLQNYTHRITTVLLVFISLNLHAQYGLDWERSFGGTENEIENVIITTADGGFIIAGTTGSDDFDVSVSYGLGDAWLVKGDANGTILWEKSYGGSAEDLATSIIQTSDGGYLFAGYSKSSDGDVGANYGDDDYWLVKTDALGAIVWEQNYGGTGRDRASSVIETAAGNYLIAGTTYSNDGDVSTNYGNTDYWLLKVDATGAIIWEKNYGGSAFDEVTEIEQTSDGGFVLIGSSSSSDGDVNSTNSTTDWWLVKIDNNGGILWSQLYGTSFFDQANAICQTVDNGFAITGHTVVSTPSNNSQFWVIKTDSLGNTLWEENYGGSDAEIAYGIEEAPEGGFFVAGYTESNDGDVGANYGGWDYWILKTDATGGIAWSQNYGGDGFEKATSLAINDDGDLLVSGISNSTNLDVSNNIGFYDYWVLKISAPAAIYGNVYLDFNSNCTFDNNDTTFSNFLAVANNTATSGFLYNNTDQSGAFYMVADTADYEVFVPYFSPFWEMNTCPTDTQIVSLSTINLSDTVNFYLSPTALCSYLEVDISTPLLRRCFSNNYHISYCNNGTEMANNAYVEIEFDSNLIIDSSSIPWTSVVGNIYTFPIGNIDVFDCGSFSVSVSVPCDSSTFLGQILCTEAHIFPDSLCLPSSNTWNGAELDAMAECIGEDSVQFTLKNVGTGNMSIDVPIIGIEDVILIMDTNEILNSGQEITWTFPTNGITTHRLVAQQPLDHPYRTFTTAAIANCNLLASAGPPPVADSAFLAYPNDEEAFFIAIDCQAVIGSYDPNDKTAFPVGVSANHYINSSTDLEYKIRFQNTGTDTAFTVVVIDSISQLLDLTSFSAGASSHPYTYNIYGTGVVEFTFSNILLPDSFIDEQGSHGFVQYKIAQNAGNTAGDLILNNADIFFDFNEPIRTNTTFNEIGGIFLDTIMYKFPAVENPNSIRELFAQEIKVYPNPSKDIMNFEFEDVQNNLSIELYDMAGKLQQKTLSTQTKVLTIHRGTLDSGMYLFKIYAEDKEIAFGKLIFN